ncbi:MAG: hypothetical protein IKW74_04775, partial [Thermoguttaceae bacterium]|nr:hypothetical protein [Thermoguttaceae bacterium]
MKSVFRMVAFGEILWDMLPTGKKPGGAPANFAYHANQLGVSTGILSSLGNDALGEEIQEYLTAHQLSMELVSHTSEYPTGTVAVHLDENGQPSYEIIQNVAWDSIPLPESTGPFVSLDAFYFGSLAARSEFNQETLRKLFAVIPQQTIRIFDL